MGSNDKRKSGIMWKAGGWVTELQAEVKKCEIPAEVANRQLYIQHKHFFFLITVLVLFPVESARQRCGRGGGRGKNGGKGDVVGGENPEGR